MNIYLKITLYLAYLVFAWLTFRVVVRKDYLARGMLSTFSVILEFAVFALHGMLSYLYLPPPITKMPPLRPAPLLNAAAFALMAVGLTGVLSAMTRLGYGSTLGQERGGVQRHGMYRFTRNPQIVFYTLIIAGFGLLWFVPETLVWVGVYLFTAHIMVLTEEEYLVKKFGEEYRQYCRKVPRYLFRLRKG
ncbi:MAG: isoprenylcysteine carboxylmethyltransferase family protein [Anaerolineales bacterium]